MTMPNPVAEVVERLRDVGCDRMPFTDDHAKCVCRLTNKAADLIERLSRERDTGVPEELISTVAEWAKWARDWSGSAFLSGDPVESEEEERGVLYADLCKLGNHMTWLEEELLKLRAAAPQPPTVSPDIVALTRERDQAREALARTERNRDMWKDQCARQADLLSAINELPQECVNSLTHQRQIDMDGCEVGVSRQAVDEIHAALMRARSVLHPEKEDNS